MAVMWNGWKLIHNYEHRGDKPEYELYRRADDLLDQHDLAQKFPEQVSKMRVLLETWRKKVAASRLPEDKTQGNLAPEELQRLRGLGYVK